MPNDPITVTMQQVDDVMARYELDFLPEAPADWREICERNCISAEPEPYPHEHVLGEGENISVTVAPSLGTLRAVAICLLIELAGAGVAFAAWGIYLRIQEVLAR